MPKISKETVSDMISGRLFVEKYTVHVNAHGEFYCDLSDRMQQAAKRSKIQTSTKRGSSGIEQLFRETKSELESVMFKLLRAAADPIQSSEYVIRYQIGGHAVWCECGEEVRRNGSDCEGEQGTDWNWRIDDSSGSGPYSLKVYAKAMEKVTTTFSDGSTKSKYLPFYDGVDNHSVNSPAAKLNAWARICETTGMFPEEENVSEIPYTAEAANFFDSLLMGIATLQKTIADRMATPEQIQEIIASDTLLLGAPH